MIYFVLLFSGEKFSFQSPGWLAPVYEKIIPKIPYLPPPRRLVGFENKDL